MRRKIYLGKERSMLNEEWRSDDARLDAEHEKLYRMLASLKAVIASGASPSIIREAVDVLRERLDLHFTQEEQSAIKFDKAGAETLRQDHQILRQLLQGLHASADTSEETRNHMLGQFLDALSKHDREVDVPIFRRLTGKVGA